MLVSILFFVAGIAIFAVGSTPLVAEIRMTRSTNQLRRDAEGWCRGRGVETSPVGWVPVSGKAPHMFVMNVAWILVVASEQYFILESQMPRLLRKSKPLVIPRSDSTITLRRGYVTDRDRQFIVRSRPPENLLDLLVDAGWIDRLDRDRVNP